LAAHCSVCRAPLAEAHRFCAGCGAPAALQEATMTGAGVAAAYVAPAVGRLASSDSVPIGGFTPGLVIAGRFRIIGLLGRGGMGEVYRADDLKLGQTVALKFLPADLRDDPVRRERFHAEVRIARQISHPNICRVYDIAEFEGRQFLSMEYVDGEDLASLLKRIGHLPGAKAVDIARQLCAGVAAAHDKGVLHRDLKPANIMLDGRGRVRITDFGLAVAMDQAREQWVMSGTPAYMAPEQLAGEAATVRSDIHALGLVLYELYTGRRAYRATTLAELRAEKDHGTLTAPSEISRDIDPLVERVIQRCIEKDPRNRPSSVLQVAAALPGGDPLAAALAAGETPSPEMVAASASSEGLRPAIAWALLALFVAGMAAQIVFGQRSVLERRMPSATAPAIMAERAREILRTAGHTAPGFDSAYGLQVDDHYLRHVTDHDRSADRWDRLRPNARIFWYRQSPQSLVRWKLSPGVNQDDPPQTRAGDARVRLDGEGRLLEITAIPPVAVEAATLAAPIDWPALFRWAGLDYSSWTASTHEWAPLLFGDQRLAWTGQLAGEPPVAARIEAATYGGRVVHFQLVTPWTVPAHAAPVPPARGQVIASLISATLFALLLIGGGVFARRNLRLGRGDRRGALRVAAAMFAAMLLLWAVSEEHVAGFAEILLFVSYTGYALFLALLVWVLYVAVEPYVRRNMPGMLVSWSRLLAGGISDPLVGRDILIGCAAGAVVAALQCVRVLLPGWLGRPAEPLTHVSELHGAAGFIGSLGFAAGFALFLSLALLFLFFLAKLLLKKDAASIAVVVLVLTLLPTSASTNVVMVLLLSLVINGIPVITLARCGLLAAFVLSFTMIAAAAAPTLFPLGAWHTPLGAAVLGVIAAVAVYGFSRSLGGRSAFGAVAQDA
jgi:hypothetical protein